MAKIENSTDAVYFLSLSLENVRCFGSKQTLDLSDGNGNPARWTVILGDNGVGKTTLLQSLANAELQESPFPYDTKKGEVLLLPLKAYFTTKETFIRNKADRLQVNIKLSYGSLLTDEKISFEEHSLFYKSGYENSVQWQYSQDIKPKNEETFVKLKHLQIYAYGATRRLTQSALFIKGNVDTTASLFDEKAELIDAEEWFLRKDYASLIKSSVQEQTQKQLKLVKEILLGILPNVTDIDFVAPSEDNFNPVLVFKTSMGNMRLGALSLGYQSMITWIVDLAVNLFERYPDSPNPIAEPAVVLIDEIDLHLHPKWQREIMSYLTKRFTNTQFIVTAHSPLIVQAAEDANIVVLKREGDEVIIHQNEESIQGWRTDQILASDLFGEIDSRSDKYEELLDKRRDILSKAKLTQADKDKLEELEFEIGDLPTADTIEDIKAMSLIHRAAKLLEAEQ